jgi:hypothetical protein
MIVFTRKEMFEQGVVGEHLGEPLAAGASGIALEECERGREILVGLIERIDAQTLGAGHGEIGEGDGVPIGTDVVIGERFRDLGEPTFAPFFQRLGDLEMQLRPAVHKQALIQGVSQEHVLEGVV